MSIFHQRPQSSSDQPRAKALEPGARARFASEFRDVTSFLRRKMVIFIDDLDRCSQDNLIDILETVNFLATSGDCYLVLGISPEWVESFAALKYEALAQEMPSDGDKREHKRRFARNYLEKMINIEVPIPKLDSQAAAFLLKPDQEKKSTKGSRMANWAASLAPHLFLASCLHHRFCFIWRKFSINLYRCLKL